MRVARVLKAALGDPARPRLLEVGCGFGYFLDVAFEEGFDVTGIEFNEHAVQRLQRKYAFPGALAPDGIMVVSTMDAESIVSLLLGKRLEDFRRTREHLFFFGRKTLASVLDEHGFEVCGLRSIGHTFELAFLLDRLSLYQRGLFRSLRAVAARLGIGSLPLRINPGTKMIAYARKRG